MDGQDRRTDGQTEAIAFPPVLTRSVKIIRCTAGRYDYVM